MKICKICVNNDILCGACSAKLNRGEITELYVSVCRALRKSGIEADFEKAVENKDFVMIVSSDASKLIGRGGRNAKKIEELVGKKVRIIEKADKKAMAEKILSTPVIGVNVLYSGDEKYRIRIQSIYRRKISQGMISVAEDILGKKVEVVYE